MHPLLAALIFAATYLVMAAGRVPAWQVERAGAAFIGAVLMVLTGVLPLHAAFAAIDLGTILLLLGMMVDDSDAVRRKIDWNQRSNAAPGA